MGAAGAPGCKAPAGTTKGSMDGGRAWRCRGASGEVSVARGRGSDPGGGPPLQTPFSLATPGPCQPGRRPGTGTDELEAPSYSGNPLPQAAADSSGRPGRRPSAARSFVSRSPGEAPAAEGARAGARPGDGLGERLGKPAPHASCSNRLRLLPAAAAAALSPAPRGTGFPRVLREAADLVKRRCVTGVLDGPPCPARPNIDPLKTQQLRLCVRLYLVKLPFLWPQDLNVRNFM